MGSHGIKKTAILQPPSHPCHRFTGDVQGVLVENPQQRLGFFPEKKNKGENGILTWKKLAMNMLEDGILT